MTCILQTSFLWYFADNVYIEQSLNYFKEIPNVFHFEYHKDDYFHSGAYGHKRQPSQYQTDPTSKDDDEYVSLIA